jgi:SNF family Na+-dependent transporter
LATLAATALVGLSIAVTPRERNVSTLSVIEAAMSADFWAISMIVFALVALAAEVDMKRRNHERWVLVVAICHIMLCSLLVGYSVAAMVGVLVRVWWNFGAPTLGLLLAYWHFVFSNRRQTRA